MAATAVTLMGGYDGTGTYQLNYLDAPGSFVVSPGDEGGPMTNGALYTGTITVGDLDAWWFTANAGDSLVVRVGRLTASAIFNPRWCFTGRTAASWVQSIPQARRRKSR